MSASGQSGRCVLERRRLDGVCRNQHDGAEPWPAPIVAFERHSTLFKALIELILDKGFDAVTVAEIAERADVGRSTFYAHYAEKEDLLQGSLDTLRGFIQQRVDEGAAGIQIQVHPDLRFCLPMAQHVGDNRELHAVFSSGAGSALISELMHEMWADFVRAGWPQGDAVAVEAVAGGFGAVINWWLATAPELTPDAIVRRFRDLVEPGMRSSAEAEPSGGATLSA